MGKAKIEVGSLEHAEMLLEQAMSIYKEYGLLSKDIRDYPAIEGREMSVEHHDAFHLFRWACLQIDDVKKRIHDYSPKWYRLAVKRLAAMADAKAIKETSRFNSDL